EGREGLIISREERGSGEGRVEAADDADVRVVPEPAANLERAGRGTAKILDDLGAAHEYPAEGLGHTGCPDHRVRRIGGRDPSFVAGLHRVQQVFDERQTGLGGHDCLLPAREPPNTSAGSQRYRAGVACVRPIPTPNPNALKFSLDITLPERF